MTKEVHKIIKEVHKVSHSEPKKSRKKSKSSSKKNPSPSGKIEGKVLQNLIELQKVHVNSAEKFEHLSDQISALLALFETAARNFATKQPGMQVTDKDKEFLDKIDKLLEQNKTIAKGLTLMEQKMRERLYGPVIPMQPQQQPERPQQRSSPSPKI